VSETANDHGEESIVRLPSQVRGHFEVYVNGVPQREGTDYVVRGRELRFSRRLAKDKISKWRWFVGAWGVGTYRQNDSVDVRYEIDGRPMVAEALEIEPVRHAPAGGDVSSET
jgi:Flp pilus assembly protein CpaB